MSSPVVTLWIAALTLPTGSPAGYVFAGVYFLANEPEFTIALATLMVPSPSPRRRCTC